MAEMTEATKHTPDYYAASGHLVEVVGCGKDRTVKFRTSKFRALDKVWKNTQPLALFVWNSTSKTWAVIFWPEFTELFVDSLADGVKEFSDGNQYVPIAFDDIVAAGQSGKLE